MMVSFNGLKILFISTEFFGIEEKIQEKLTELGADVDYFNERPSNGTIAKGIIRLKPSIATRFIANYYRSILKEIAFKNYDFLFVLKGEAVPRFFLEEFIRTSPKSKRIYYTWDSMRNNPLAVENLDLFDCSYTFDDQDSIKYQMQLRPLFYIHEFAKIAKHNAQVKFDVLHVGTAHSDRYEVTSRLFAWCQQKSLKTYAYFYLQSWMIFVFKKLFSNEIRSLRLSEVNFTSLTFVELLDLYASSRVILDINHPDQAGLTMRTLEAIGSQRKLITTNSNIKNYCFYNPKNIMVIDRDARELDEMFFIEPYEQLDETHYEGLSLTGWLNEIFGCLANSLWL